MPAGRPSRDLDGTARPLYAERQIVRAADLTAQQAYLITIRRRHNLVHHGWGVVTGLELGGTAFGVTIAPGMAIDGYGRELILRGEATIAADLLERLGGAVDLWLLYDRIETAPTPKGRHDSLHSRLREAVAVHVTQTNAVNPMGPTEPDPEPDFQAALLSPDDADRRWPVYLGRAQRTDTGTAPAVTIQVDTGEGPPRPSAFGATVRAPSDGARLQIGGENSADVRRFVISVRDPVAGMVDRLTMDREGNTSILGRTVLADVGSGAALTLKPKRMGAPPSAFDVTPSNAPAPTPAPWRIYRAAPVEDGGAAEELRVELFDPGKEGDPAAHRLAVGHRVSPAPFHGCLVARADGAVVIEGDLEVKGKLIKSPAATIADDALPGGFLEQWVTDFAGIASTASPQQLLSVVLVVPTATGPEAPLTLDIAVRNDANAAVSGVAVYAAATSGDRVVFNTRLTEGRTITTNGTLAVQVTKPPPHPQGVLRFVIMAIGVGPSKRPLFGTHTMPVKVSD